MTRSQVIALRCAESLPKYLLLHRFEDEFRHEMRKIKNLRRISEAFLIQLEECKSDEARRILLGVSR